MVHLEGTSQSQGDKILKHGALVRSNLFETWCRTKNEFGKVKAIKKYSQAYLNSNE